VDHAVTQVEEATVSVYTLGIWTVKPGREDEFVAAWREMATGTKADFPEATAVLLRDREQPNRFISAGPWESLDRIRDWRSSAAFGDGVARMRELLEDFEPHTMDPVVTVDR
jgi:heme-degrading monooxygenase HmoA